MTLFVGALALTAGRAPLRAVLMTFAVFNGQLFVGWTNDLLDSRLDAAAGRADKPLATLQVPRAQVRRAAVVGAVLVVPLSLTAGPLAGAAHLLAVVSATAYNLGLKRTPFSVLPYAIAFGLVPAFVTLGPPITHLPPLWATAAGALMGAGAHFTQSLTDIDRERRAGIRGLPQVLGERASAAAGASLMAVAAVLIAIGPGHPNAWLDAGVIAALGLLAAILIATAIGRLVLAFRLTLLVAGVVVAGLLLSGVSL